MAAGAPDVEIGEPVPELSRVEPPANRANLVEWENVQRADWRDDEVSHYSETAVMENEMDVLDWWKINKSSYPKLAKFQS